MPYQYFEAPIIKILDLKSKERIVIDQNFKMRGRMHLLNYIKNNGNVTKEEEIFDKKPEAGFFERALKWRYHFALVPLAVVVIFFIAKSTFNLEEEIKPAEFKNEVLMMEDMNQAVPEAAMHPRIETFPGYMVLPQLKERDASMNIQAVVENKIDFPVSFKENFTEEERKDIESNFINPLITDKKIAYIIVSKNSGLLFLEVYYLDESVSNFTYEYKE